MKCLIIIHFSLQLKYNQRKLIYVLMLNTTELQVDGCFDGPKPHLVPRQQEDKDLTQTSEI